MERPDGGRRKMFDTGFAIITAIAVAGGIGVWVVHGPARFFEVLGQDLFFAAVLLPKVFGGILLAVTLGFLLPKDRVMRMTGPESGVKGLIVAGIAGAVIPGGASVTFPLTAGMLAAGADLGAGVAMVSGWVLLGLNRTVIWELSFLPADLVWLRVVLTLPVPVVLGLLVRHTVRALGPAEEGGR